MPFIDDERYDGGCPNRLWDRSVSDLEPVVADAHTAPNSGSVLEVAVGMADLLALAVDNEQDRALYVGPSYSYDEFTSRTRLTDREWTDRLLRTDQAQRPARVRTWTSPALSPAATIAPTPNPEPPSAAPGPAPRCAPPCERPSKPVLPVSTE